MISFSFLLNRENLDTHTHTHTHTHTYIYIERERERGTILNVERWEEKKRVVKRWLSFKSKLLIDFSGEK